MKLKLIFPYPAWINVSNKYYISIHRNKIDKYNGLHPLRKIGLSESKNSEVSINSEFYIHKLDKLDRRELNTKATHKIVCQKLHDKVYGCDPYCVRLNWFQEFYINWYGRKYIIQSKEIKTDIIKYIIGAILGFIGGFSYQKLMEYTSISEKPSESQVKIDTNDMENNMFTNENDSEINLTDIDSVRKNLNGFWVSEKDTKADKILWLSFEKGENSSSWEIIPFTEEIKRTKEIPITSCTTFINLIKIKDSVQIQFVSLNGQDTTKIRKLTKRKFKIDKLTYLKHKGYDFLK